MSKSEKTSLAVLLVLGGFLYSVGVHYWNGAYNRLEFPRSTYLCNPKDQFDQTVTKRYHIFGDFLQPWVQTQAPNPYGRTPEAPFSSNYFPFAHRVLLPFTWLSFDSALAAFVSLFWGGLLVFVWSQVKTGETSGFSAAGWRDALVLSLASYPAQFVVDRGNIEGLLFLFVALFYVFFQKKSYRWAGFFLACATAMKLYPGLLMLLFLTEKKKKEFWLSGLTVVGLTILSLASMQVGMLQGLHDLYGGLRYYATVMSGGLAALQHGSSLFALIGIPFEMAAEGSFLKLALGFLSRIYSLFALLLLGVTVWAQLRGRLKTWESLTILVGAMVLVPRVSYDYKLILWTVPFMAFLNAETDRKTSWIYTVCFSLLFIPKNFWLLIEDVSISPVVNPLAMLVMIAPLLRKGLLVGENQLKEPSTIAMPASLPVTPA